MPSPNIDGGLPIFADRGQRQDPDNGNYELTGRGGANHPKNLACQSWVGVAHGVLKALSEDVSESRDNIYEDQKGKNDSFLLSSEENAGPGRP